MPDDFTCHGKTPLGVEGLYNDLKSPTCILPVLHILTSTFDTSESWKRTTGWRLNITKCLQYYVFHFMSHKFVCWMNLLWANWKHDNYIIHQQYYILDIYKIHLSCNIDRMYSGSAAPLVSKPRWWASFLYLVWWSAQLPFQSTDQFINHCHKCGIGCPYIRANDPC